MPYILKNNNLEIEIDYPNENYNFSRFDWTGKITKVKFQDLPVSTFETTNCENEHIYGKGFYNEFGIDTALGFEDTDVGGWFHKIGVGLLRKDDNEYQFSKKYDIKPAKFEITNDSNKTIMLCNSESVNGYSYFLKKEIEIHENSFSIKYFLKNTGQKDIITDEYTHNFIALNNDMIGTNYILKFPFDLKTKLFNETVNTEQKVNICKNEFSFNDSPNDPFFFSNLSGNENVDSKWELLNIQNNIGISEIGDFKTNKINLWGWKHVISPELFFNIFLKRNQSTEWTRTYNVYKIK
ncbi:MAG: hypothetical protein NWQ07_04170 [Flaviramulus sp.]|nr:hypothetical protein [Flaviramulus sp.]